ncbi:Uma2 family endonuclease [Actinoallomurus soli]|uniref:Uma2 family endonuclease n=1 Tax=Actinoallomurus soli TaxID=2952535 RepID=UPI0020923627|nr:Uma2 family endonuclease [Actinoallomurus soli]MCO5973716.1 Uma2 family endonuclease [Actinoallomurus soli]
MPDMATTSLPRTPMIAVPDWPYGPYTVDDLDALPDEGVRRELVNGWIFVAPWPSTFHDHAAKKLERALEDAAAAAATDVYIKGPLDIDTGPSIRVPDIVVVEGEAARAARARRARAYDAADVLLVVEIVSPRSGSEQHDRVDKVFEYARAGIPQYWLVDLEPEPCVVTRRLGDDGRYHVTGSADQGSALKTDEPFPFTFDVASLVD